MVEKIHENKCKDGSINYCIASCDQYYSVTVLKNGDYYLKHNGAYCFANYAHGRILKHVKPSGENITVLKHYNKY